MTSRERFRAALYHTDQDRVPVYAGRFEGLHDKAENLYRDVYYALIVANAATRIR